MLLIKSYYLVFLVFIHAVVGVCELVAWLRHPRRSLMVASEQKSRASFMSFLQANSRFERSQLAGWRSRPMPLYVK